MQLLDAAATAARLPYERLIPAVAEAMLALRDGRLHSCTRSVLPLPEGGSYLAMPCTDERYAICKLVSVNPANRARGLPTIHGRVLASDAATGVPLALLDGATVTARRTAAVSLLGIETLLGRPPQDLTLVGTGQQAASHLEALLSRWPGLRIRVVGRTLAAAEAFVRQQPRAGLQAASLPDALQRCDCVLAATTALTPVLPEGIADATLIVGIGSFTPQMAELPSGELRRRQVFVDDADGARHEAGDLLQAGVDWQSVRGLADLLDARLALPSGPKAYKTVGHAAWDLAAVHCALG
ncbi:delta(1)-pyrroline-2-carboxylate reductase family protein [Paucibacter sp. APW11]|uniref:Delta(1)-pyrroline-2-carboxylate reductase family protein n=1 Tax=Roseateles aquae TaxID=3077235 RepID=A0ABU3P513_9BURK|nr:delta(1)-pyrroline-2-carboxylate reductase family protein [Paucibacter sp. APW11]MDT8997664.1 delta(1)-pyrroline-2-carboxylate reductase family protein [Paucibacter sp. APW11]